ncbi:MAG TPA: hypothetical protein VLL95_02655 [Phnomibacter sp.]|nr:hypothetical protein [Phnomibacter sp.]
MEANRKLRFGVMTLLYYSEGTIVEMIDNCAPFVDKIYVGFSELPWSDYNKNARTEFKGSASLEVLKDSKWHDKIEVISGVWKSEVDERNDILSKARQDGMDYLIIQDADEFYHPEDYRRNIEGITANPNHPVYRCPWTVFWKNTENVILIRPDMYSKPTTVTTCPNFAVNCNMPDVQFAVTRLANRMNEAFMLTGLCLHLAWVLDDEKVWMKVQTWGHSHQFNGKKWFKHKWLAWKPSTSYIGNITRANYLKAVPFKGELPEQLKTMPQLKQEYVPLTMAEKLDCMIMDATSVVLQSLKILKARTKRLLGQS